MKKQGWKIDIKHSCIVMVFSRLMLAIGMCFLSACLANIWTGASLVYDRHNVYEQIDDYYLSANVHRSLFKDKIFKQDGCVLDVAVFNNDILLAGHLPSETLRKLAENRIRELSGYRHLYNQIAISDNNSNAIQDGWITTKIRSKILVDSEINPKDFKILTSDQIVYVMGDVKPMQAKKVLKIASNTNAVIRVVKLLKYYNLSNQPSAQ